MIQCNDLYTKSDLSVFRIDRMQRASQVVLVVDNTCLPAQFPNPAHTHTYKSWFPIGIFGYKNKLFSSLNMSALLEPLINHLASLSFPEILHCLIPKILSAVEHLSNDRSESTDNFISKALRYVTEIKSWTFFLLKLFGHKNFFFGLTHIEMFFPRIHYWCTCVFLRAVVTKYHKLSVKMTEGYPPQFWELDKQNLGVSKVLCLWKL